SIGLGLELKRNPLPRLPVGVKFASNGCSSSAKMSPQNCSAILSPPRLGSSSQKGRRSDERLGVKGEPERCFSDARGTAHTRRAGDCRKSGQAFRDFSTSDEAATAQNERARC